MSFDQERLIGGNLALQERLDRATIAGVNLSTLAFVGLQIPQIIKNFTDDPKEMATLSWAGYVSGSMGNLLLATYFAGINEWAQVRVQAIGAITNYFVATQVFLAGYFPAPQFWTLAIIIVVGLLIPLMFSLNCLSQAAFDKWKEATTPIGLAALVFSITATFNSHTLTLLAVAVVGLVIGILLLCCVSRCPSIEPLTAKLGGWLATFLFMWMPLPQIAKMLQVGESAAKSFSMGFTVLATIGNGLGSTRAFVIKEKVWFTGSFFGLMVGGWATAVVVYAVRPQQCPLPVLIAYTVFLVLYFSVIVLLNGRAKQEKLFQQASFLCKSS